MNALMAPITQPESPRKGSQMRLPYSFRGALIFGIIFFPILWGEGFVYACPPCVLAWGVLGLNRMLSLSYLLVGGPNPQRYGASEEMLVTTLLLYLAIGAFLGWIYGMRKFRRSR
jgi:hypothetical protein